MGYKPNGVSVSPKHGQQRCVPIPHTYISRGDISVNKNVLVASVNECIVENKGQKSFK